MGRKSMKQLIVILLGLSLASVFGGCASMSKNQCLQADWYEIGNRDGRRGKPRTLFQAHYDTCLEHGVHADRQAYFRGRADGLRAFCTFDNGLALGKEGKTYRQICPPQLETDFLAGFEKGKRIYVYNSRVAALENRLKSIERQIRSRERMLADENTSDRRRTELRNDLRVLDLQYRQAAIDLKALQDNPPPE